MGDFVKADRHATELATVAERILDVWGGPATPTPQVTHGILDALCDADARLRRRRDAFCRASISQCYREIPDPPLQVAHSRLLQLEDRELPPQPAFYREFRSVARRGCEDAVYRAVCDAFRRRQEKAFHQTMRDLEERCLNRLAEALPDDLEPWSRSPTGVFLARGLDGPVLNALTVRFHDEGVPVVLKLDEIQYADIAPGNPICRNVNTLHRAWYPETPDERLPFPGLEPFPPTAEVLHKGSKPSRQQRSSGSNYRKILNVFDRLRSDIDSGALVEHYKTVEGLNGEGAQRLQHPILGCSRATAELAKMIEKFARYVRPVLVTGERGSGKDLVARAIHARSPRSARTFNPTSSADFQEQMLPSELFGHKEGSFTGAGENRSGIVRQAAGGTVFLDEIGDASPSVQATLLRFLQEGTIRPVGADAEVAADARVIAATNRNVDEALRRDLIDRFPFRIFLEPLRLRLEDLLVIVPHLWVQASSGGSVAPGSVAPPPAAGSWTNAVEPEALATLLLCDWPGNIREVANLLERTRAVAPDDANPTAPLTVDLLNTGWAADMPPMPTPTSNQTNLVARALKALADAEAQPSLESVLNALKRFKGPGRFLKVAEYLGVSVAAVRGTLRIEIQRRLKAGETQNQIAAALVISQPTVKDLLKNP